MNNDKDQKLGALGSELVSSGRNLKTALNLYIATIIIIFLSLIFSIVLHSILITVLFGIVLLILLFISISSLFSSAENLITAGQLFLNTETVIKTTNSLTQNESQNISKLIVSKDILVGNYTEILELVNQYNEDGITNWRLPTFNELKNILRNKDLISQKNIPKNKFWCSEVTESGKVRTIDFTYGIGNETKIYEIWSAIFVKEKT
jgi:hypothetical protein